MSSEPAMGALPNLGFSKSLRGNVVLVTAIGPGALFGLITFSHKIGLYDVQGPIPVVKYVVIPPDMDGRLPVDLDMAMPLPAFLAPVCWTPAQ